jgi:hydroxypyruvate isomerase
MANLSQSFSWWCVHNRGVESADLIRGAVKIGFAGVELVGEEHWAAITDAGLKIVSIDGHGSIENGLNRRDQAARIEKELQVKIEKAVKWKIPVLICFSGSRGSEGDEAGMAVCAETLARIAPAAEQAGVTLAVELLNSKVDHKGYQCDHTAWGVRLCEQVKSPAVKLLYDIYHMQIMEGDLIRTIGEHHGHFAHYHTAGNPGRGPMDDTQEINYPPIYRAIAETNYTGYIGHEFIPRGEPLKELRVAFEQVRGA